MELSAGTPATPGEVARRVRIVSGVPWRRLFGYLQAAHRPVQPGAGRAGPGVGPCAARAAGRRRARHGGRRRRELGCARRARRGAGRAVPGAIAGQLRPVVLPGRGGGADRRPDAGRAVRPPGDALARLPLAEPGRRTGLASLERRDPGPDDAHPDDHLAPVVGHRAHRLGRDPVHPEPDAAPGRPSPRAGPDRGGHPVRSAAAAREHRGPGRDRPQHRHRRGGAGRDPRGQELRPRGLRGGALRGGPVRRRGARARASPCGAPGSVP